MRGNTLGGDVLAQEGEVAGIVGDDGDVGDVALVARARMGQRVQRQHVSIVTAGVTCPRRINVDTTASTSRADLDAPPPPAGPLV